jgi:hypothetical protein
VKKRHGFVSNSSSSSFVAFALTDKDTIEQLIKAEGLWREYKNEDMLSEGYCGGNVVEFWGWDNEAHFAGWSFIDNMLEDKTVKQFRQEFVQTVKDKLGVEIDVKCHIGINGGICGDG